jgi:hypothetical protein
MTNRKRELIAEAERDAARMKAQDEADRIEQEVERRVQERSEQERAARKPPIYRSTLSPKQKSELMRKMGPKLYLGLPWSASRP